MFKELTKFYEVGKELGLNKMEIRRLFLFEGKHSLLYKFLLILSFLILGVVVVIAIIFIYKAVYPSGALYSTVRNDDFKKKSKIIY
ncbi:MAG: hypothetical protein ACFFA6_09575 [Promethearchaeota archaeon]